MKLKNTATKIKAGPDDGLPEGEFTAYASVFDNTDSYGDVIRKGAFAQSLKEWADTDAPIPALFGHRMDDPDFNIGHVKSAVEDDHGLLVTVQLDLESPKAMQTYRLLKGRRINQMSFAYDVRDGSMQKDGDREFYELRNLKLHEVSVVPIGANQETEILAVKAHTDALTAEVKAGRVLAQKHIDSLRSAQEALGAVIAAAQGDDQDEKASDTTGTKVAANDEEPAQVKSPADTDPDRRVPSVDTILATIHITERSLG